MARPVRGCPTPHSQQEHTESESNSTVPQQEEQPDAAEGEDIVDYDLDIDSDGSKPKNEPAAQEEKKEGMQSMHKFFQIWDIPPEDDIL